MPSSQVVLLVDGRISVTRFRQRHYDPGFVEKSNANTYLSKTNKAFMR